MQLGAIFTLCRSLQNSHRFQTEVFKVFLVGVIGWCILMDLKIQTKSSVIGSVILKYVLKSCVIRLMIHKF